MSIDAIINKVTPDGDDLVIELMAREIGGIAGQDKMRIEKFTHIPIVGQEIWGGGGSCIIEPSCGIDEQRYYQREGYTLLLENFDCPGKSKSEVKCPHCEGGKGYQGLLTPEWIEPPEYEWFPCRTCKGKGKITELQNAIYKARGGPVPIVFRGYA
ncbi:hypothetical protein LCGC14_1165480 [marine sediment metagenome]|uniref:Uncharacterized protein n=1 Tax=marine sediment metagenome TaxID=412755 RepID=A0A0F9LWA0_9ZZZZ